MTEDQIGAFLSGAMGVCALMTVANLLMVKRRGTSAFCLSGAFLALGVGVFLYKQGAPTWSFYLTGVVVFALLATDMLLRSAQMADWGSRK